MKILVTGGAGFIGSEFVRQHLRRHAADQIVNLDKLTYAGSEGRIVELVAEPRHEFVRGDICDLETVRRAMVGRDAVIHFAAESHVDRSIVDGQPFLETNVQGTYVLLQAARELGIQRFLHISTDEVYGPILHGRVKEDARLNPTNPYSASKAAAEHLAMAFHVTHKLPVLVTRSCNAYGPWQFPEKFVALAITNALDERPVPIYGDGRQARDWLHVEDLCEAIEIVFQRGEVGAIYNIAGGDERVNLDAAQAILTHLDRPQTLLQFVEDRPGHDRRYAIDDRKLRALGWRPRVPFEEGLRRTIAWYQAHREWWEPIKRDPHYQTYYQRQYQGTSAQVTSHKFPGVPVSKLPRR